MATNAPQLSQAPRTGWVESAFAGIEMSLDLVNEKRIKIVINGGGANPKGLAEKTQELVRRGFVIGIDERNIVMTA